MALEYWVMVVCRFVYISFFHSIHNWCIIFMWQVRVTMYMIYWVTIFLSCFWVTSTGRGFNCYNKKIVTMVSYLSHLFIINIIIINIQLHFGRFFLHFFSFRKKENNLINIIWIDSDWHIVVALFCTRTNGQQFQPAFCPNPYDTNLRKKIWFDWLRERYSIERQRLKAHNRQTWVGVQVNNYRYECVSVCVVGCLCPILLRINTHSSKGEYIR